MVDAPTNVEKDPKDPKDPIVPALPPADDFTSEFDRLAKLGDAPPTKTEAKPKEPAPAPADDKTDPPVEEEEIVGDLPTPEQKIAADEAAAAAAAATPEPKVEPAPTANAEFAKQLAEAIRSASTPAKDDTKPAPKQEPEPPVLSDDERKVVANYMKEWPDVARAEEIVRRVEQRQIVAYVFSEVSKYLTPLQEQLADLQGRTYKQDLHAAIPDYDATTRDKVLEWANKQPSYLQAAYKHVVENGTVEEVADLINRYKTEAGVKTAPVAAAKKDTELPASAKKAAAALAPVGSKRSAVVTTPSKDDFDGAFAAFANET